jgi:hypothetical protein
MALGKKAYPRATVKKIIKAHSNMNVKKNADVTVSKTRFSIQEGPFALTTENRYF